MNKMLLEGRLFCSRNNKTRVWMFYRVGHKNRIPTCQLINYVFQQ